jgi:NADH-quinone oxidoreductase subunit L
MHEAMHEATEAAMSVVDIHYLWLVPLFPLIGAVINGLFGLRLQRTFGKKAITLIGVALPWAAFVVALTAVLQLAKAPPGTILVDKVWTWFSTGTWLNVDFAFAVDRLSAMMVLIVTFIGSLIHVYATGYMAEDKAYWRFFTYLNLFLFAMLLLVLGDNALLMFVGWEGVGLCSYLLIGFWYEDVNNAKAGMKAFVVNRIGDFGFLVGFFILFWGLGGDFASGGAYHMGHQYSITFRDLPPLAEQALHAHKTLWGVDLFTLVGIFFFIGATGKSAQIPLYIWLPDAMAGPTPVSALIHAATMVTAGVYMVARMNFMYVHSPLAMTVITVIGALTALFAATIGVTQYDIKKVLAYSTVSQLGFMFIGVGVGAYWAGAYHLLTHAFFKACLFLGAGSVILAMHHEQDMRKMGGLGKVMPVTRWTYWVSCVAISGFPIASGFYSKDEILWQAFNSGQVMWGLGPVVWAVGFVTAGITSFYMWRSYFMTFTGPVATVAAHHDAHADDDAHAAADHGHAAHGHDAHAAHGHDAHGHGAAHAHAAPAPAAAHKAHGDAHDAHDTTPHEQPWNIVGVLAALAIGAVLVSFIGLPMLWTGKAPWLEHWLAPVFTAAEELPKRFSGAEAHHLEWILMAASISVATVGMGFAWWMYRGRSNEAPARIKAAFPRLNNLVFNKYFVDELYAATVVRGFMGTARTCFSFDSGIVDGLVNTVGRVTKAFAMFDGAIDKYVVDGFVNYIGTGTRELGAELRRLQTGQVAQYLGAVAAGAVVLVVIARFLLDVYT